MPRKRVLNLRVDFIHIHRRKQRRDEERTIFVIMSLWGGRSTGDAEDGSSNSSSDISTAASEAGGGGIPSSSSMVFLSYDERLRKGVGVVLVWCCCLRWYGKGWQRNSLLQKISDLNFAPARPRVVRDPGIETGSWNVCLSTVRKQRCNALSSWLMVFQSSLDLFLFGSLISHFLFSQL